MYVYLNSQSGVWTVGFYSPDGTWNPESDHRTEQEAVRRVHYLNGGRDELVFEALKRVVSVDKTFDLADALQEARAVVVRWESMQA